MCLDDQIGGLTVLAYNGWSSKLYWSVSSHSGAEVFICLNRLQQQGTSKLDRPDDDLVPLF